MGSNIYLKRDNNEFYPTIEWVRDELYKEIDKYDFKKILDPCCGSGGLEKFNCGYDYTLFDIVDRNIGAQICDFLQAAPEKVYDCVIMNPPFGQTVEFVRKAKQFSDNVFLIAPIKTTINYFGEAIKWCSLNYRYCFTFGILTSIALYHLDFNYKKFGTPPGSTYKKYLGEKIKDTWDNHFFETDKAPDKPFIVDRLTKARVIRDEQLIKDGDLYDAGDESAFIAQVGNLNVKAGDHIKRRICTFDSWKEMKDYQKKYDKLQDSYRFYMYKYGDTVLQMYDKPW